MNTDRGIDYMMLELIYTVRFNICEHLKYTRDPPTKVYLGVNDPRTQRFGACKSLID